MSKKKLTYSIIRLHSFKYASDSLLDQINAIPTQTKGIALLVVTYKKSKNATKAYEKISSNEGFLGLHFFVTCAEHLSKCCNFTSLPFYQKAFPVAFCTNITNDTLRSSGFILRMAGPSVHLCVI